jgi:hypothetical protein
MGDHDSYSDYCSVEFESIQYGISSSLSPK